MNADDVKPKTDSPYTPPSDPSAYIRTYAKDVATLTNSPAPKPVAAPAKATSSEDGVTLASFDPSPVNHAGDPASPKEFKSEVEVLSKSDSDNIFNSSVGNATPVSVPLTPQGSIGITPNVTQINNIGQRPEEIQEQKEVILARLRAKLASHTSSTPAPAIEAVAPIAIQEVKIPTPPQEPVLITPPQFVQPVEPPAVPLPIPEPAGASPIHTFSSDFSDRIDSQGASAFSVIAAQSDSRTKVLPARKKSNYLVPVLAGVLLLVFGVGGVTAAYVYSKKTSSVPIVAGVPSLVTFDESVEVTGAGAKLMQSISDVAGQTSINGNIIVTYIKAPDATGISVPQPGGALIEALSLGAPTILIRNIDESSTVGTIHAGSESRPFLILRVNSYERTFAGMLAWEPDMAQSLATFFPAYTDVSTAVIATTSSSSPVLPTTSSVSSPFFSDAVVANHDVRVLRDSKGRSLILYGYQGKDTLVIARDEAAFTALIARITATPAK